MLFRLSVFPQSFCDHFSFAQALDTIIVGLVTYYNYRDSAMWAAFVLYWISVVLTLAVDFGLLIIQMTKQEEHSISDVAGLCV